MNDVKKAKITRTIQPLLSDGESIDILFKMMYSRRLIPFVINELESKYSRPVNIKRKKDRELIDNIIDYYLEHDVDNTSKSTRTLIAKAISKVGLREDN